MKKYLFYLLSALFFAADQLSKWAVTELVLRPALLGETASLGFGAWLSNAPPRLPPVQIPVLPFFDLVMVWNKGISFGIFHTQADYGPLLLGAMSLGIVAFFAVWLWKSTSLFQNFGLSLIIGGALGNVFDRARFGAVVDFLDFHVAGLHFPAFNVADSCVCVGVFLLILYAFLFEKRPKDDKTVSIPQA